MLTVNDFELTDQHFSKCGLWTSDYSYGGRRGVVGIGEDTDILSASPWDQKYFHNNSMMHFPFHYVDIWADGVETVMA